MVIKGPNASEVTGEDNRTAASIEDDDAPVPDDVGESRHAPALVCGAHERRGCRVVGNSVPEPPQQIIAIVETALPCQHFVSFDSGALVKTGERDARGHCCLL